MLPVRFTFLTFVLVILCACGVSAPSTGSPEVATPDTALEVRAPLVTATALLNTSTAVPTGYPAPDTGLAAYPDPGIATWTPRALDGSNSYPGPVTPVLPTATPVPFPEVESLPLSATWFTKNDALSCGGTLYARSTDGTIVKWERLLVGAFPRPGTTPLLVSCSPETIGSGSMDIQLVDMTQGTTLDVALNRTEGEIIYQFSSMLASADGRYLLVDGVPLRDTAGNRNGFWGMYRIEVTTGTVVPLIQYATDFANLDQNYAEAGAAWDSHIPVRWDADGLIVHTIASGAHQMWHFTWQADAPLPYSVAAGTLTVEALDQEWTWPPSLWSTYTEPSLPAHLKNSTLIYTPMP